MYTKSEQKRLPLEIKIGEVRYNKIVCSRDHNIFLFSSHVLVQQP